MVELLYNITYTFNVKNIINIAINVHKYIFFIYNSEIYLFEIEE